MRIHLVLLLLSFTSLMQGVEIKKQKINGVELAYYTRGQGEPMVMIMGFKGTMAFWDPALLEELEKHFTLILFDNRGVGLSTDTQEDKTTIAQMAEDTAELIKALGYEKAHILGWSLGSRIALQLTLNQPEKVRTLTLCSPNPGGKYQAVRRTPAYTELTSTHLSDEAALRLLFPEQEGKKALAEFVLRLGKAVVAGTVPDDLQFKQETVNRQLRALQEWDRNNTIYEKLPSIRTPTLVTGGLQDVLDSPENVRIVARRIPFAWSAYFPNAGHAFLAQAHSEFARLVILFAQTTK